MFQEIKFINTIDWNQILNSNQWYFFYYKEINNQTIIKNIFFWKEKYNADVVISDFGIFIDSSKINFQLKNNTYFENDLYFQCFQNNLKAIKNEIINYNI